MNPILARFDRQPGLISPDSRAWFEACVARADALLQTISDAASEPAMQDDFWPSPGSYMTQYRPYVVRDGVLHIPVKGVLLHDFPYADGRWATGYDYIARALRRGLEDGNVRGIALIVHSPGGEVAGNFELADRFFAARGVKPTRAFVNDMAYSAAYSLASACDFIHVTRTSGVGSIGVITSHVDFSKALENYGEKITLIFAGKHKADGNPYEALPADVKARIQARLDELYSVFVSTVARNRAMDETAVRATEALTFTATQALSNGLADTIGSLDDALADYSASLNPDQGDETMAEITQADVDAARAEGKTAGLSEGLAAEKARITGILGCDAAKERPAAALAAALDTDMSVDQAGAFLAKLPSEAKPIAVAQPAGAGAPKGMFEAAMNQGGGADVGAGDGGNGASADDLAIEQSFGGRKPNKAA